MQDPPLLPDSDYPSWLWQLGDTRPPLSQLRRAKDDELTFEQVGLWKLALQALCKETFRSSKPITSVADRIIPSYAQQQRLLKLENRELIRDRNASKAKRQ